LIQYAGVPATASVGVKLAILSTYSNCQSDTGVPVNELLEKVIKIEFIPEG
jgi:hypothetical protein